MRQKFTPPGTESVKNKIIVDTEKLTIEIHDKIFTDVDELKSYLRTIKYDGDKYFKHYFNWNIVSNNSYINNIFINYKLKGIIFPCQTLDEL
jgi:hypothetical protein